MRLIDADALIQRTYEAEKNVGHVGNLAKTVMDGIRSEVNNAPTAYNVNKVIEQLEDYLFEKYCVEGYTKIEEIVKGGGVDE